MSMKSAMRKNVLANVGTSGLEIQNLAGGVAFTMKDDATKLVTMTGGSFFNEPRYYTDPVKTDKIKTLTALGLTDVAETAMGNLEPSAKEIIETASAIAAGKNPEYLLIIANWLRNAMNIRTTPQVLLVIASRIKASQPYVRKYAKAIVLRPDEVKTCILIHNFLFGHKTIKNCLGQALSDAMARFNEKALLKYDGVTWPTWKDVLQVLPRSKGKPLSKPLSKYFLSGEITDATVTPIAAKRKLLAKCTSFDETAKKLALETGVNWEVLLSQFGSKDKTPLWEFLIDNNLLGYMALMRNLSNILDADVKASSIDSVISKLTDKDEVVNSKQLPFRYLAAKSMIESKGTDALKTRKVVTAIKKACDLSIVNLPKMPGVTVVFADNSGSMDTAISDKSKMSCKDAANMLCGISAKSSDGAYVYAFGTDVGHVKYDDTNTVLDIADKTKDTDIGGYGTNGHLCIRECMKLLSKGIKIDRVILLSDMQLWNSASGYAGNDNFNTAWKQFHKNSPKTWLHSVHLNGYGTSVTDKQHNVFQVGSFSEKIVSMFLEAEGLGTKETAVPLMEQLVKTHSIV